MTQLEMNQRYEEELQSIRQELTRQSARLVSIAIGSSDSRIAEAANKAEFIVDKARQVLFDAAR